MAGPEDPKKQSAKLREKALKERRKTREKIKADHPGLLDSMRERLSNPDQAALQSEELMIDREKNLKAVMQFLAISQQSKSFESKLKKMLMDVQKGTEH